MTTDLAMFPLELVAFPGEKLALHIFEERYQELLKDCEEGKITFGIPTYLNNKMQYGTEVEVVQVVKRYPSGASDIICRGLQVFELVNFQNKLGDKLYAGGTVRFIENLNDATQQRRSKFINLLMAFYAELDIETPTVDPVTFSSFTYAHKLGLTLDQEYALLKMSSANDRYHYLIDHLQVMLSTLKSVNRAKDLIKLNGHFKNFDPLDFEDYTSN